MSTVSTTVRAVKSIGDVLNVIIPALDEAGVEVDAYGPTGITVEVDGNPLRIAFDGPDVPLCSEPWEPETDAYAPSPEERSEAAALAFGMPLSPRTPDELLESVRGHLNAMGLDPTVHKETMTFLFIGRTYTMELVDMDAMFDHLEKTLNDDAPVYEEW